MSGSQVFGVVLAIAAGANLALAADIVDNGDFALGLDLWDTTRSGGGSHTIEVLDTFEGYTDVLHLKRTGAGADGGRQRVWQVFSASPGECIAGTAKLTARFKVRSHNLHNSGCGCVSTEALASIHSISRSTAKTPGASGAWVCWGTRIASS